MVRKKLMAGVVMLALLAAIAGCAADVEQPSEPASIDVVQPTEPASIDVAQPPAEANTFALKGWVTVDAYRYDAATGTYIRFYHHEGSNVIMEIGLDYVEAQLGGTPVASAHWIALSSLDTQDPPPATWTKLPNEITDANGLARAAGTFDGTVGQGVWEIEKTFDVAALASYTGVQQTGLHWEGTSGGDDTLFAAEHFTAVNLSEFDTLKITWQLTVSGVP